MCAGATRTLAIMAKRPAPGHTKTRLIPRLGPDGAAEFYECLLLDTIDRAERAASVFDLTPVVALDTPESAGYFRAIAPDMVQVRQRGADLGARLDTVLSGCLDLGVEAAFAIGSDSPDVPEANLAEAFAVLDRVDVDVVLGPATDGGYYLIGWKRRWPAMVTEVTMSTPQVLTDTLKIADRLGARVALAPEWHDIDEPADLDRLANTIDERLAPRTAAFLAAGSHR